MCHDLQAPSPNSSPRLRSMVTPAGSSAPHQPGPFGEIAPSILARSFIGIDGRAQESWRTKPAPAIDDRVLLVTHPRSCGTAIELFLEAVGLRAECNLFDRDYYLLRRARGANPPRKASVSDEDCFEAVARRVLSDTGPYLARVAGYTLRPLFKERLFPEFLGSFDHIILLIRDPAYSLLSHRRLLSQFGDALTSTEAGYASLVKLSRFMDRQHLPYRILDSHDALKDPTKAFSFLGAELPREVTWPSGMRARWGLWREWKEDAARSTRLNPPREDTVLHARGEQDPLYRRCLLEYRYLKQISGDLH